MQVSDKVPMGGSCDLFGPLEQVLRTAFSKVANALGKEGLDPFEPRRLGDSD